MTTLRTRISTWIVISLVIGLSLVLVTLGNYRFAVLSPGGNDFMTHYAAWDAYLNHSLNPYSDEAALFAQQLIYGRPAAPTEDQNRLAYPFYSIALHGPFVLIRDYPLARAIYMTLLEIALLSGVWLTIRMFGWRPPLWLLAATLLWVVLDYAQARGLILGQFAIFGFFSVAVTLYLLQRRRDGWAGALLVLATMKPTLIFLIVPFLLLWALLRRRWRFVVGFGITLGGALLVSWLMLPTWLTDWLLRVDRYSTYTVGQSPVWLLTHQALPGLGQTGELLLSVLLLGLLLAAWWRAFKLPDDDHFYWTIGLTLIVSDLIVPRSATTNYVLLLLPTLWLFTQLERHRRGHAIIGGYLLITVVGQWWLHTVTVVGNQEQAIMFLPLPLVLGVAFIVIRPRRPPAQRLPT